MASSREVVSRIADHISNRLRQAVPILQFPFAQAMESSPYILSFFVPGIPSDVIVRHLEQQGIMISSRSACSSKKQELSDELAALGVLPNLHQNGLRLSFAQTTTLDEVSEFCDRFIETVALLQQLSGD